VDVGGHLFVTTLSGQARDDELRPLGRLSRVEPRPGLRRSERTAPTLRVS
jgi:hypothetical protein